MPAVLRYLNDFRDADEAGIERFFLAATAIGALCKRNASISGAEVGKAAVTSMVGLLREGTKLPLVSIAKTEIVNADNWKAKGVVCT